MWKVGWKKKNQNNSYFWTNAKYTENVLDGLSFLSDIWLAVCLASDQSQLYFFFLFCFQFPGCWYDHMVTYGAIFTPILQNSEADSLRNSEADSLLILCWERWAGLAVLKKNDMVKRIGKETERVVQKYFDPREDNHERSTLILEFRGPLFHPAFKLATDCFCKWLW